MRTQAVVMFSSEHLRKKYPVLTAKTNNVFVCIDEMAITPSLHYLNSKDKVIGFEDKCGRSLGKEVVTSALVFMVCGVNRPWK